MKLNNCHYYYYILFLLYLQLKAILFKEIYIRLRNILNAENLCVTFVNLRGHLTFNLTITFFSQIVDPNRVKLISLKNINFYFSIVIYLSE